jgi:hypothetical protein
VLPSLRTLAGTRPRLTTARNRGACLGRERTIRRLAVRQPPIGSRHRPRRSTRYRSIGASSCRATNRSGRDRREPAIRGATESTRWASAPDIPRAAPGAAQTALRCNHARQVAVINRIEVAMARMTRTYRPVDLHRDHRPSKPRASSSELDIARSSVLATRHCSPECRDRRRFPLLKACAPRGTSCYL